jgi:hypothetical protein
MMESLCLDQQTMTDVQISDEQIMEACVQCIFTVVPRGPVHIDLCTV